MSRMGDAEISIRELWECLVIPCYVLALDFVSGFGWPDPEPTVRCYVCSSHSLVSAVVS